MSLLVFTTIGFVALVVSYGVGLGGQVGAIIGLTIIFVGALLHTARPLIERLRP